ncbi:hypothetical protein OHA72_51135 [Dactylosporangium sp. NBC_01737]|uniref:hypothetical protein n=1 Tax=Dactylosporangium sp. NBC_01737 TaxID=2975959 RepID=UPI002E101E90|nr:hypothetical protein OHA72_51135 [Dactylosporangium sp. NBC_01737]
MSWPGPAGTSAHELGAIISRVLGRPVEARRIDADTYLRAWVGDADPAEVTHQLRVLRSITTCIGRGLAEELRRRGNTVTVAGAACPSCRRSPRPARVRGASGWTCPARRRSPPWRPGCSPSNRTSTWWSTTPASCSATKA